MRSVQPHKILETFYFCVQVVDEYGIEFINFIFNRVSSSMFSFLTTF